MRTLFLSLTFTFVTLSSLIAAPIPRIPKGDPDPGNLTKYRGKNNQTYQFQVTGSINGTVYGTGIYTDDSSLSTVAVHAGLLKSGEVGIVKVTILRGQSKYTSSTQNGVTSRPYGQWGGSYSVKLVKKLANAPKINGKAILNDPGSLTGYRTKTGESFYFRVKGTKTGTVYGTNVFTDDSSLATAAVHAGIIKAGETKIVKVTILPGQQSYVSSTKNGITSRAYGPWTGSYVIEAVKKK